MSRDPWAGTPYRRPTARDKARIVGGTIANAAMELIADALDAGVRAAAGRVLDRTSEATDRMKGAVERAKDRVKR